MVRTQIQLPDSVYREAKRIAAQREMSLAEVVRRGLEQMARLYPPSASSDEEWSPPPPMKLGPFLSGPGEWRELANETSARLLRRR